jgi:hypothetical protein
MFRCDFDTIIKPALFLVNNEYNPNVPVATAIDHAVVVESTTCSGLQGATTSTTTITTTTTTTTSNSNTTPSTTTKRVTKATRKPTKSASSTWNESEILKMKAKLSKRAPRYMKMNSFEQMAITNYLQKGRETHQINNSNSSTAFQLANELNSLQMQIQQGMLTSL